MSKSIYLVLYILAMVAIIVAVDVLFFSHLFWYRLISNIAIVVAFAAVYLGFLKNL